jgi:Phage P22-like portal protein
VANKKTTDSEILELALERFKLAEEAYTEIRRVGLEDLEFRAGVQWPKEIEHSRSIESRPCLTINRIPQFIRQVTNDQRQNRPSIKVSPVDDVADIDTAKVFQGLIRHIEYDSNAEIAFDTAFEGAATKGFGFYRVLTEYCDPLSFEQQIKIKNYAFIVDEIPRDDFIAEYGESKLSQMQDWEVLGAQTEGWVSKSTVKIAEYFYRDFKKSTIFQLSTGEVFEKSKMPEFFPEGVSIVGERETMIPVIYWCKLNGIEILQKTEWPGKWIPIIPVYGDELHVNGKRIFEGIVRHAKDSQRMYNYWASTETETIALAPKAPFIVAEGQIPKEYEAQWKSANTRTHAYLVYKPTTLSGALVGAPQRNVYEAPVQAITNARMQASEDMKATTGIYDAALGSRGNESSGVAIQRRNAQSQTSNFHFIDNLTRSLRHTGRILVDLIPKIYDTERTARIIGEDGQQEIVKINALFEKDGKAVEYKLGFGKYDVTVETGPSFATKRQEALASMIDLVRGYPQMAQVAGDLMVKNMDWPGASEIAERLKKTLPPQLQDQKDQPQMQVPPEMQSQMEQMNQMIDQLSQQLTQANEAIKNKTVELESKERIEFAKMEVDLKKELLKQQGQAALATYQAELQDVQRRLDILGINDPFQNEFNESVAESDAIQDNQQPTDGFSSGQITEEQSL